VILMRRIVAAFTLGLLLVVSGLLAQEPSEETKGTVVSLVVKGIV
jgi:hypothetical protein